MESGSYGVINSMFQWRFSMLKTLGINFSEKFSDYVFCQLPEYRGTYPILYKGIICTNQQPKGKSSRCIHRQTKK